MGTHSCVCWGWGSRKRDRKFPPTPPPTSLSSSCCWTPSQAARGSRGSHIPVPPGQGQGAGIRGRESACVPRREGGPHPTHYSARNGALCLRSSLSHPEEKARGSRDLGQGDRWEGLVCSGVSLLSGANGVGSEDPNKCSSSPLCKTSSQSSQPVFYSLVHAAQVTHTVRVPPVLHTHLLCCQTRSHHTHTHTRVIQSFLHL